MSVLNSVVRQTRIVKRLGRGRDVFLYVRRERPKIWLGRFADRTGGDAVPQLASPSVDLCQAQQGEQLKSASEFGVLEFCMEIREVFAPAPCARVWRS